MSPDSDTALSHTLVVLIVILLVQNIYATPMGFSKLNDPKIIQTTPSGATSIKSDISKTQRTRYTLQDVTTTPLSIETDSKQAAIPMKLKSLPLMSSSSSLSSSSSSPQKPPPIPPPAAVKQSSANSTKTFQKSQIPFLTATTVTTTVSHDSPALVNETFQLFFNPPSINELVVNSNQTVFFNCSSSVSSATTAGSQHQDNNRANVSFGNNKGLHNTNSPVHHLSIANNVPTTNTTISNITTNFTTTTTSTTTVKDAKYLVIVTTSDGKVAQLMSKSPKKRRRKKRIFNERDYDLVDSLSMHVKLNEVNNFTIEAMHIGYVTMSITLIDTGVDSGDMAKVAFYKALSHAKYPLSVVRAEKLADFVFDCSAAAVAILISFGIGCVTDTESLKRQLKYPVSLIIGFCCQFLLMPVLAFGIAMMLPLDKNIRFGLLCVACVPGGGLGHVAVIVSQSDLPLSLAMNLISIIAMLGTAPLWIFVLGQYFQRNNGSKIIPIYNFEIWLASTFFAYTAGLMINRFKPNVADALLTWLIKPFLLLATILYITLGVYINMYVFEVIETYAVIAAMLLPTSGFAITFALSKIFRQKAEFCQSAALETSSFNCLIVLAAIRFSLPKPEADLASEIPMWVMFTIPGMYVGLAVLRIFKKCISNFMESRKQQQFRHFSIASGIVNQANMAALSAPLFVTEVTDDEQGSVSEKITVL